MRLSELGASLVRQRGSHQRWRFGDCFTTVPVHAGETLGRGLLAAIERDMAPCIGMGWLS